MDGTNYRGWRDAGRDTRAADRQAVRTALLMALVMVLGTVAVVLCLAAAGLPMPAAQEFQTPDWGS